MDKLLDGVVAILLGAAAVLAYYGGGNLLIDRIWQDKIAPDGTVLASRIETREKVRPWLFVLPAILLLGFFLVYPAVNTLYYSFFDKFSRDFVGLDNYSWAIHDNGFQTSVRNNFLWLLIVPFFSTAFGLIVAVLADRVRWESFAKALIFMPMAISFVGASIIWKFVYAYRDIGQHQIGLLNQIVVSLGGQPQTWTTQEPINNFFLMIILIWIQTGFAMVLLSAALKGVPEETLEAARIDGANEFQIFFRIMIPQIAGTIAVVMTTIIIVVLKVFDIVITMTDGQFGTEVLANYMDRTMFRGDPDFGRGSVVAIAIMVAIIPIMVYNIRRFQQEEALR